MICLKEKGVEKMRTISFEVTGQHIECTEAISDLVGNTREYVQAKFSLPTEWDGLIPVSYTHLTLPTILLV